MSWDFVNHHMVSPFCNRVCLPLSLAIQQEGDSLGAMEKVCRQLTYHLSPHSRWRRQGLLKRKPQAWWVSVCVCVCVCVRVCVSLRYSMCLSACHQCVIICCSFGRHGKIHWCLCLVIFSPSHGHSWSRLPTQLPSFPPSVSLFAFFAQSWLSKCLCVSLLPELHFSFCVILFGFYSVTYKHSHG